MEKPIVVLNESEIRKCVSLNTESLEEVAKGFTALSKGAVTLPSILRIDVPENHGEVDVKTAYIHGLDSFAIKIAAGFFDNRKLGLPTGSGMMVLISAKTGNPIAILLDNGYLTDVRTGIAGAIAAKYLAPKEVKVAGVIGSGMQARYQIRALKLVRSFSRLMVFGIVEDEVDTYAWEISKELDIEVIKVKDPETVVQESSVVVTTTPSKEPYLRTGWLHPGLHITCMGSDSEDKQELYADVFSKADRIVCDRKSQAFRLGELHHALDAGVISERADIIELGELTSGAKTGRQSKDEITVCDLTGVGVQDTQIARLAYHRAVERGMGLKIS
jgi:ornithine cyclodeaminase